MHKYMRLLHTSRLRKFLSPLFWRHYVNPLDRLLWRLVFVTSQVRFL